ncbi:serralysin [Bradyrhizobium sp. AZCC 1719]|uniref:M10 family metallopeptidase C-terminal domain-containing protein n=1 Tax=Bradyrhizobium sp. AZCC 1719 TaxID=3117028 RepID=UPI002FF34CE1
MKKNDLFSDEIWPFQPFASGAGDRALQPEGTQDQEFGDEGEPYPLALEAASVSSGEAYAAKPVASIATLADYLVNGFWQYNNNIAHRFASNTITFNINGLNSAEQFLALSALQAWSDVANISFVQTSGSANITFTHNGTMQAYSSGSWPGGWIASAIVNISTDWVTTDGGANDGKTGIDSYAYQTYIHEIGHALGLGHQGPYNGSASYSTNAIYANDTWQYSIMSYFGEHNYSGSSYRYVVTPQMADIYAMASIYGAATSTRIGDTVYGFSSNAGAVFNFGNYTSAPALTIYDSGGNDTLDCSGYSSAQTIDLHAGAFSSIGSLVNNIGIALNAIIEKAIGGSGNDRLIASDSGCTLSGGNGNDTLDGGTGNDIIVGGFGTDVAIFSGARSSYVFTYNSATQTFTVIDQRSSGQLDGVDTLTGVENFQFSDGTFASTTFVSPTVIEAFGATSLVQNSSYYFLQSNSSGAGPQLYCFGAPVVVGQFGAWTPIATEQTSSGYQVVLKNGTADSYIVWSLDSNGNYLTNTVAASGASSGIVSLETSFQQDLNGDGTIGVPVVSGTAIESFGSTKLVQVGNNYYLASVSSNTGPELKIYGAPVAVGQFGAWTPIATEQTSSGYQVVLKNGTADSYIVWSLDSNGNYLTNTVAASGTSSGIVSLETSFQQDLNGDGTMGVPVVSGTAIESFGSTKLVQVGNNYYLASVSSNTGPELKIYGAPVAVGQFGAWTPIATEQTSSGYQVVLKNGTADSYIVWSLDSNGNYLTNTVAASGTSSGIVSLETSFQQDLNGDGTLGVPVVSGTAIESFGSTKLVQVGNNYYLASVSSNTGPELKIYGAPVVVGQFGTWTPIATEQTSSGYQVVLKNGTADSYIVWSLDSNGNYLTNTVAASGTSSGIVSLETSFQQDLNGDGTIGVPIVSGTAIESFGSTKLVQVGNNYYLASVSSNTGPELKIYGAPVAVGQFGTWTPIATEQTSSGYQVVLKNGTADSYIVWSLDSNGNYITNTAAASGSSSTIESLEPSFQQDLNGDGVMGVGSPTVVSTASSLNISEAPAVFGSDSSFLFRADLGVQTGEANSVVLAEFLALGSNPRLESFLMNAEADSLPALRHTANGTQDATVDTSNYDSVKFQASELYAGHFILHT